MLSLEEIIKATSGTPLGLEDLTLKPTGVSTDSRTLAQGELFVALKGPYYDGGDFVEDAFAKGAISCIVSNPVGLPRTISVKDTLIALGEIAKAYRSTLDIPVIVITGTNGKTTVKNILKALLDVRYKTFANKGNRNNLIGLPLSILEIDEEVEIAILEAGISARGELTRLCDISKPTHGLITNVGPGHLEELGTLEDVLEAKWELGEAVTRNKGVLFLNSDYPELLKRAQQAGMETRTFAVQNNTEFTPVEVKYGMEGTSFKFMGEAFRLPLLGAANLANAVAALSVAVGGFEITLEEAATVLSEVKPEKWRLERRDIGDMHLLMDCYNANPVSMKEAFGLLTLFPAPRIAVLGAMLELGKESSKYHEEIIEMARDTADLVIITGPHSELYPPHEGVMVIPDKIEAAEELRKRLLPGASVLVKGSRACALEDIVSLIWGTA